MLETAPEIDLVVIEVMMPEIDGWGLIERLRADEAVLASPDESRALLRALSLLKQVGERRIQQTA